MTEAEFRELLEYARGELVSLGLGDLAEDELYRITPEEDALLPPDKHLIEMLGRTLDALALFDSSTIAGALHVIDRVTEDSPQGAEVILPTESGRRRLDLSDELPNLTETRGRLGQLIGQLLEARPER